MTQTEDNDLNRALRIFEATEANLVRLERLAKGIRDLVPDGISFGSNTAYDELCRSFHDILDVLPSIDGWKPGVVFDDLNSVAQNRLDAAEIDEVMILVSLEERLAEPARSMAAYRYQFNKKRRAVIRSTLEATVSSIDEKLKLLALRYPEESPRSTTPIADDEDFAATLQQVEEIDALLGSSVERPSRWIDLRRHLHFGQRGDLFDIVTRDWPKVREGLAQVLYQEDDPLPVGVDDLSEIVNAQPRGRVITQLKWHSLTDEDFERLIFNLISTSSGYQNPAWLTKTNAPDRGRDLSVERVNADSLGGVQNYRVIIQCKHWNSKSLSVADISTLRDEMRLWEPPRVDVLVLATTGRFTSDAVSLIERHNTSDNALRIEMWPESHLESLLAKRPDVIAEFHLR